MSFPAKSLPFVLLLCSFSLSQNQLFGQQTSLENLTTLQESSASIRENIESMKMLSETEGLSVRLNQLDSVAILVDQEIAQLVPAEDPTTDEEGDFPDVPESETIDMQSDWNVEIDQEVEEEKEDDFQVSKFTPFKKKSDAGLRIQFGINSLYNDSEPVPGFAYPEINTGSSWYWDLGLIKKIRLGGKHSRVAFLFGVSWLINRYSFQNDVVLKENSVDNPEFVVLENTTKHPKLNVGYINLPVNFRFSLSRKLKLELGGYAGYRLHSVQKTSFKSGKDHIHTQRYSDFHLNNWLYGASANISLAGLNVMCRYSFSDLFEKNPNYNFNTFMIGTSVTLF